MRRDFLASAAVKVQNFDGHSRFVDDCSSESLQSDVVKFNGEGLNISRTVSMDVHIGQEAGVRFCIGLHPRAGDELNRISKTNSRDSACSLRSDLP